MTLFRFTQGIRAESRGEYGSHDSRRATALLSAGNDKGGVSLDGAWLKTNGIDTLGRGGERDGHANLSLGAKAEVRPAPDGELGLVGGSAERRVGKGCVGPCRFRE